MDENSSKPDQNTFAQLSSLAIAVQWLDGEGSASRPGHLLKTLVTTTEDALRSGQAPPAMDSGTLAEIWRQEMAPRTTDVAALRNKVVEDWWKARQQSLLQRLQDRSVELLPVLEVLRGGGRSNPNRYRLAFEPLAPDSTVELDDDQSGQEPSQTLTYRIDSARPALWLRLLLGSKPFPIASWRGYILLGTAVVNFLLIALLAWIQYMRWSRPVPVTTDAIAGLLVTVALAGLLWWGTRPVRMLPSQRVTLASAPYLTLNQHSGQFRAMPESGTGDRRRMFSVVRHWGTCTACAAEVDLDDGRLEFPGRLVGRCHDAPTEHVFSFDPVTLTGQPLRPQAPVDGRL
ncbi:hypothetical protein [Luteimonas sp. A478]